MDMPLMTRKIALLLLVAILPFAGCNKIREKVPFLKKKEVAATPAPAPVAAADPVAAAPEVSASTAPSAPSTNPSTKPSATKPSEPSAAPVNKNAAVIALCYHNIEDGSKMRALTIPVAEFEKEMDAIKKNGFSVIGMREFLAWRRR